MVSKPEMVMETRAGIAVGPFSTALAIAFTSVCAKSPVQPCQTLLLTSWLLSCCAWFSLSPYSQECSRLHWWPFLFCKNAAIISKSFWWAQNNLKMFQSVSLDEMTLFFEAIMWKRSPPKLVWSCGMIVSYFPLSVYITVLLLEGTIFK